ncbi:MAG: hypothetical protein V7L14_22560 [Nostoc sp.]|uniref:hypothetical protein n=1 Tax=Nostoc sp. TaxID=1180 RepID=UPI002FF7579A
MPLQRLVLRKSYPISTHRGFEMRPDIRNHQRVILDDRERAFDLWQRVSYHVRLITY